MVLIRFWALLLFLSFQAQNTVQLPGNIVWKANELTVIACNVIMCKIMCMNRNVSFLSCTQEYFRGCDHPVNLVIPEIQKASKVAVLLWWESLCTLSS